MSKAVLDASSVVEHCEPIVLNVVIVVVVVDDDDDDENDVGEIFCFCDDLKLNFMTIFYLCICVVFVFYCVLLFYL